MSIPSLPSLIGINFPVAYSPSWRTIIQEAISGKDTRVQLWTYPRYKYEIGFSYLGAGANWRANVDWATLVAFFNSVGGAALPFHWNNPYDNAAVNQQLGVGDGVNQTFNFIRSLGGFLEPVQDVTAVSNVKVNSSTTGAYTLLTDPNFGLTYALHFNSPPGAGQAVQASFTYNWCVQFDSDVADFENFLFTYWRLKKIAFTTKKVL